ncbi:hypothetical protein CAP35_15510 [Chitinophagaceae bacterium IBVUCB1]|nr:hypothetical protein CAP35_15510 [Chitinophagaceae bacterium IBVUCB1]
MEAGTYMNSVKKSLILLIMIMSSAKLLAQKPEVRLIAESTYGHNGTTFYATDTTAYEYNGIRGSNIATQTHLYDTCTYWTIAGSSLTPKTRIRRTYDAFDRIATHTAEVFGLSLAWHNRVRYEYKYQTGNLFDSVFEWRWDTLASIWNLKRVQVYSYKAGVLDTIHWFRPISSTLAIEGYDVYTYIAGNIASHTLQIRNDSLLQWDVWEEERYHYNTTGRLDTYTVHRLNYTTLQTLPANREVYEYGSNGKVSSHYYYEWNEPALRWEGDYWHYFFYNANNTIDIETVNYWDIIAQQWGPQSRYYYYYDAKLNITDIAETRFFFPNYENFSKQTWVYNSKNHPTRYSKYYWIAATAFWMPEQSTNSQKNYYYEYENSHIASATDTYNDWNLYPNPTGGSMVTLAATNHNYNSGTVWLTDIQGRLLRNYQLLAGTNQLLIPVGDLVQGIYMLTIKFADKEMTKTLTIAR